MRSKLLGLLCIIVGIAVMAGTLVLTFNPLGNYATPSILVGVGSLVAALFLVIAFSGRG